VITGWIAILIVLGEWTGLVRGLIGVPVFAAALDGALVLLVGIAAVRAWRDQRLPTVHPLDLVILGFALLALIQILNPNVPSLSVGLEGFRKTAFTVLAYVAIRLSGETDARSFFRLVALGSIPALLWAIRQSFAPLPMDLAIIETAGASEISFRAGVAIRAFAPTAGPFHLGILAGTVLVIAVALSRTVPRWILLSLLAGAALGLSITRANIIAAALAIVVMALLQVDLRERLRLVAFGVPAIVLALGMAVVATSTPDIPGLPEPPPPVASPTTGGQGDGNGGPGDGGSPVEVPSLGDDTNLQYRLIFWREQLDAFRERPLIGYGTSSAADGFGNDYEGTGSRHFGPHSVYTKPALELGIVGLVLFLTILVGAFLAILRIVKTDRLLATLAMGILVLVAASGLTGPMLDAYPFNVLFWATLGWVVASQPKRSLAAQPDGIATVAHPAT
jgi:O-Antigen ligase